MTKYNAYLNQDTGSKWTTGYWIAAVSKWFQYTILGDKDGNLIDPDHPLDVKVGSSALPTGAATSAKQDTLAGLVGEVQANPTENTVLERLKVLETELQDIKSTSGVKKITDAVDISDKAARELGVVTLGGSLAPLSGQKNVTTAGAAVALGGDQKYDEITIIAKSTNTGNIFIGPSTVDSSTGCILPAGGFVTLKFVNTKDIYIDADVSGEGVSWMGVV